MKIKELKKLLKEIPDFYDVDLSVVFLLRGEEDLLECILDHKIFAIASSDLEKHCRFIIETKDAKDSKKLGKLKLIK